MTHRVQSQLTDTHTHTDIHLKLKFITKYLSLLSPFTTGYIYDDDSAADDDVIHDT